MEGEENIELPLEDLVLENENENENERDELVEGIRNITGYEFSDRRLLVQAFTHHSYNENCSSYERLEYIGDSVLNLMVAEEHYFLYPDLQPGDLTRLRAANVDTEKLARAALKHHLYKFLRHNKPFLARQIKEFEDAVVEYPLHSWGLIDAPKALADIVESLIGAIYIDSNSSMNITCQITKDLLQPVITRESVQTHPVTMLYEICQKNGRKVNIRDSWRKTGEIEIFVDGKFAGRGKYDAKKLIAVNRAAHNAYQQILRKLVHENSQYVPSPN